METLANFFNSINEYIGVSGPGELIFNPYFIGLCLVMFVYSIWTGMKVVSVPLGAIMGGALIYQYLWPKGDSSGLGDLLGAFAAFGVLALILIYIGFIRE